MSRRFRRLFTSKHDGLFGAKGVKVIYRSPFNTLAWFYIPPAVAAESNQTLSFTASPVLQFASANYDLCPRKDWSEPQQLVHRTHATNSLPLPSDRSSVNSCTCFNFPILYEAVNLASVLRHGELTLGEIGTGIPALCFSGIADPRAVHHAAKAELHLCG